CKTGEEESLSPHAPPVKLVFWRRHRIAANLPLAFRRSHEIRLVIVPAEIAGIVVAIIVDANGQDHDLRFDAIPQPQHRQVLLIGSIARHAGIDHQVVWQLPLQEIAETFLELGVVAEGERIPDEQKRAWARFAELSFAYSQAVGLNRDGAIARGRPS